jgi:tetratricopeptide (TPR) repeat protein
LTTEHPTPEILDGLLTGTLSGAALRRVVLHVSVPCAECQAYLGQSLEPSGRYGPAVWTARQEAGPGLGAVRAAGQRAAVLWAELEGTPPGQRLRRVENDARFHGWELAARCLDAAADCPWEDPPGRVLACRVALAIAERLPEGLYSPGLRQDLVARALGGLADAQRFDEDLEGARATLVRAQGALVKGTLHPLERAGLLRVEASLLLDEGEAAGAAELLRPAAALYRRFGDPHREGRVVQKLAWVVGHENPAAAVVLARRAIALIDPGWEPAAALAARHGLCWFLNDCGRPERALEELERAGPLYQVCRERGPHIARPWLEARICRRLGELAAAERGLRAAWRVFEQAGFVRDQTLASLDLAETLLALGRGRQALRVLEVARGNLERFQMHGEGIAAVQVLVEAARGEAAAAQGLLREASLYFRRAWGRAVPFSPAAG